MSIMSNEDYMYMYSQLKTEKIPQDIQNKIFNGFFLTDTEEKEIKKIIDDDKKQNNLRIFER